MDTMNEKEQLKKDFEKYQNYAGWELRDKMVVALRLGLVDGKTHTLEEIGEMFDISRERVRQIESKILFRLEMLIRDLTRKNESGKLKRKVEKRN